jgi:hypothetical protein
VLDDWSAAVLLYVSDMSEGIERVTVRPSIGRR